MKYKGAIVDDEREYLEKISMLLDRYSQIKQKNVIFEVDLFSDGDKFLCGNPESYEIIFLDINMPGTNGMRTAKSLRAVNPTAILIFCTHYAQYAINGYEVNAFGYIVKPIEATSFNGNLDRAINALKVSQARKILVKTLHGVEIVPISDIIYVEIQIHNLYYYIFNYKNEPDVYRTRGSMQEVCKMLSEFAFERCSACYLVNLRHVVSVANNEIVLRGGVTLPISRKFLKIFTDSFMKFLGGNGTINA